MLRGEEGRPWRKSGEEPVHSIHSQGRDGGSRMHRRWRLSLTSIPT